jgi:hypothetical protein
MRRSSAEGQSPIFGSFQSTRRFCPLRSGSGPRCETGAENFLPPVPQGSFRDAGVIQPPPSIDMPRAGPEPDTGAGVAGQHHALGVI